MQGAAGRARGCRQVKKGESDIHPLRPSVRYDRPKFAESKRKFRSERQNRGRQITMLDHLQDDQQQEGLVGCQSLRSVHPKLAQRCEPFRFRIQ